MSVPMCSSPAEAAFPAFVRMASWEAIMSIILTFTTLAIMAAELMPPDMAIMGCTVLMVCLGFLSIEDAVKGFSSSGLLTVAVLFIVAKGLTQAGSLEYVTSFYRLTARFVSGHGVRPLIYHAVFPLGCLSAFINNTPIVAMMVPVIQDYARMTRIPPSKIMIPLSYGVMFGGTVTLIGTSTNLVALALAEEDMPGFKFSLFTQTPVGLPVLLSGMLFLGIFGPWLLPERMGVAESVQNPREYMTEMAVASDAPFVGKSIEAAGLRGLHGLFLVHVERGAVSTPAPAPDFVLQADDKLSFAGEVDSVLELTKVRGLIVVESQAENVDLHRLTRTEEMVEVVISPSSPLIGQPIRETNFRAQYGAAIIAVHRSGERVEGRIGDIVLKTADTLLVLANDKDFARQHERDSSFSLVSKVRHFTPVQRRMAPIAIACVIAMIVVPAKVKTIKLLLTTMITVAAFLFLRIISPRQAREALNLEIIITIAASYGLSKGLVEAGGAEILADGLVKLAHPFGKPGFYFFIYLTTAIFSAIVTNNAAVSMTYPIAYAAALKEGHDMTDILLLLIFGASASFSTPTGYQCNLMVWGPGGYKYTDFIKFGGLCNIWTAFITIALIFGRHWWYAQTAGLVVINLLLFLWSLRGKKKFEAKLDKSPSEQTASGSGPRTSDVAQPV
eukprot:jgi/Mesvir1/5201/Mv15333-RA.1